MKRKLTWLAGWLCAALALGLVFWLRPNGEKESGFAAEGNRPRVTKPYPRERDARETRTKSPREEFEAARKRGLTEEEVRGVVEDFLGLRITFENHQDFTEHQYLEMGNKARDWYKDLLVEGFGLAEIQDLVLTKMLREYGNNDLELFKNRKSRFLELRNKIDTGDLSPQDYGLMLEFGEGKNLSCNFGLSGESVIPWNLIELSDSQKEMIGYQDAGGEWILGDGGERASDYGITKFDSALMDPFAGVSEVMYTAGEIFPLSKWQVERLGDFEYESVSPHTPKTKSGDVPDRVKFLTRPQLKTLLLFNPEMAGYLMKELGA